MNKSNDHVIGRRMLGRYRVVRPLAQGGMGAVYLARVEGAAGFAKPVVVKRILPDLCGLHNEQTLFIQEAQILSNLRHPGIVDVIDFGKEDDAYLMVLEYVQGYHLGQWLKYVTRTRGAMPWELCVFVMIQVLSALHYAHTYTRPDGQQVTIIHRDVSPSNILIDIDGSVRIVDFGIARMAMGRAGKEFTVTGDFRGKLTYASPEQFKNGPVTPAVDAYASAVVLYQLLSGINPFSAEEPSVVLGRVTTFVPPPISTVRDGLPAGLDEVLSKALSKEVGDRHPNALEFAEALRGLLETPDAEIAAQLTAAVRKDYKGELPSRLKVDSLSELDDAWRNALWNSIVPAMPSTPTIKETPLARSRTNTVTPASALARLPDPVALSTGISKWRFILALTVGWFFVGGALVFTLIATRSRNTTAQPRFLVVEANNDHGGGVSGSNVSAGSASVTSVASVASATDARTNAGAKSPNNEMKARDPASDFSYVFAKRQAAIQSCFQSSATNVSGAPEVSIRFSIDTYGKVVFASVRPAVVAVTALGQCLERVARATEFGPQDKPFVFTIPITTRARNTKDDRELTQL